MNKDNTWKTQATLLWKHSREKNDKQYFSLSKQNVGKFCCLQKYKQIVILNYRYN